MYGVVAPIARFVITGLDIGMHGRKKFFLCELFGLLQVK